nr:threonine ammonia-lyase IlvA [Liquorilactobacillus sicerae]
MQQEDVENAYKIIKSYVTHTPLQYDEYLSQKYNCNLYLKREDLQKVRSFKLRGACYSILQTPEKQRQKGVVCASAGNHAQGVAWTAHHLKIPAAIFMPVTTPKQKINQVKFFGKENVSIELVGDTFDATAEAAEKYCHKKNLTFIAPFNDLNTMAGQGTLAKELLDDAIQADLKFDYLFCTIGGGGLISGVGAYTKGVSPTTKIIGVEPLGAASMKEAFAANYPVPLKKMDKFVDGAAVKKVGNLTFANANKYVDQLTTVPEGHVCTTVLELYDREAIVAEPAGALSISALDNYKTKIEGKNVVCILSGGNNDIERIPEIKERSLIYEGKQYYFIVKFPQRPGALKEFVTEVLGIGDDITKFEYTKKMNKETGPVLIGIRLGKVKQINDLKKRMRIFDPNYIDLQQNKILYEMMV